MMIFSFHKTLQSTFYFSDNREWENGIARKIGRVITNKRAPNMSPLPGNGSVTISTRLSWLLTRH